MTTATAEKKPKPKIPRHDVKSEQIKSRGYDKETKTLVLEFVKGGVYHYADYPEKHYEQFLKAKSAGQFFHSNIRDQFKGVKQPPEA